MKRVLLTLALIASSLCPASAILPRGGVATTTNALTTLIAGMSPNTWKQLDAGSFFTGDQIAETAANFDGTYVSTTGSWSASSSTISVTSASGIMVGDYVVGTGIPAPDWVTNISGTTLTLLNQTTGSSGGTVAANFAYQFWPGPTSAPAGAINGCGSTVWDYTHAPIRNVPDLPQVSIQGDGHAAGCDHSLYFFDPVACAAAINASNPTAAACHWSIKVKTARVLPAFDPSTGLSNKPSWSCQKDQDLNYSTASFSSGVTSINVTLNAVNLGTGVGAFNVSSTIWGPGIAYGTTVTTQSGTAPNLTLTLSQATTGAETSSPVYFSSGLSDAQAWAVSAATTAGSATVVGPAASPVWFATGGGLFAFGPTISAGALFSGQRSSMSPNFTLSNSNLADVPAALSQASGAFFLAGFFEGTTNADGVQIGQGVHGYSRNFAVPGTTKWSQGAGNFSWPYASGGGASYIWDSSNNSYNILEGPPICFSYGDGTQVNGLDGLPYAVLANGTLVKYTSPYTTPTQVTLGTGSALGLGGGWLTVLMQDSVNGAGHRMFFVDQSTNSLNQFTVWFDIGGTPSGHVGSYLTNPNTIFSRAGASSINNNRAYCGSSDGKIYAWEGGTQVSVITPTNSATAANWDIAVKGNPMTGPNQPLTDEDLSMSCLGSAYQNALLAVGNGEVWVYKP